MTPCSNWKSSLCPQLNWAQSCNTDVKYFWYIWDMTIYCTTIQPGIKGTRKKKTSDSPQMRVVTEELHSMYETSLNQDIFMHDVGAEGKLIHYWHFNGHRMWNSLKHSGIKKNILSTCFSEACIGHDQSNQAPSFPIKAPCCHNSVIWETVLSWSTTKAFSPEDTNILLPELQNPHKWMYGTWN